EREARRDRPRLGGRDAHRRKRAGVQPALRVPAAQFTIDRRDHERPVRYRAGDAAGRRTAARAPASAQDRLAQSIAGARGLRAAGRGHAGGVAVDRRVRPGAQPRHPRGARKAIGEPVTPYASNIDVVMTDALREKANRLAAAGKPFALATVVRSEAPTSARPGAKAIVTADGDIEGWIGGGCAQPAVIKVAKQVLQDGRPRLIRISPEKDLPADPGILDFGMSCASGGTLDIFIEAVTTRPVLLIIGQSPVAQALSGIAGRVGFSVTVAFPGADRQAFPEADRIEQTLTPLELPADVPAFVVVATQGRRDEEGLEAALASGAPYIAFVASRRKAATLKQYLKERGHAAERV